MTKKTAMAECSENVVSTTVMEAGRKLGYQLRVQQQKEVVKFISGRDVFISLPNGSGKSLCYSVLPWTNDRLRNRRKPSSLIIVVSPLVALMKDQV